MTKQEKRENIIRALENCNAPEKCRDCPWEECEKPDCKHSDYPDELIAHAIALLKAQEPVKPLKMAVDFVHKEPVVFSYECPVCMCGLQRYWVACPICGTGVRFE